MEKAQQLAYDKYLPGILGRHHTATHWLKAMSFTILTHTLQTWETRCQLKKGANKNEQLKIQRDKLLPLYHHALLSMIIYITTELSLQSLTLIPPQTPP